VTDVTTNIDAICRTVSESCYDAEREPPLTDLASKTCIPCRGGVPALKGSELKALHAQVPDWTVVDEHHITRNFGFPDFKQALDFVNRVGAVAEAQGHHPDILLAWGKAEITMWTHKINGLTESDFIMAAKIDQLYQ
jgi:4a-hydroxytetrahydrobiopterin dehydratase